MALKFKFLPYLGRLAGAIGVVLWITTPLTYLLSDEVGALLIGKMVVGSLLCGLYVLTNAHFLGRLLGARSSGLFAMSLLSALLVLLAVGGVNVLAALHPWEADLTRDKLYTLSDQTQQVLEKLGDPVELQAFYSSSEAAYPTVQEILERYARHGRGKLQVSLIDPQNRPDLVEQYQLTDRGPRIVLRQGDREARAREPEEQELTQALIKVTTSRRQRLYFLQGHGEGDLTLGEQNEGFKGLGDALASEGYEVEPLSFMAAPKSADGNALRVPEDADLVVLLGPQRPLLQPEVGALQAYLHAGGHLVALLEPHKKVGLDELLKPYGILPRNDLIIDTNPLNRLMGLGPASPIVQQESGSHPLLRRGAAPLIMSTVQSLALDVDGAADLPPEGLAAPGDGAWGETNLSKDGTAARDANDNSPPLFVVAAAEKPVDDKNTARLIVVGDADWLSNRYLPMQGNQDFFLNMVGWSIQREDKISIRPRNRAASRLYLSGAQLSRLKFFSMDLLPVLIMAFGLAVVLVRRQR